MEEVEDIRMGDETEAITGAGLVVSAAGTEVVASAAETAAPAPSPLDPQNPFGWDKNRQQMHNHLVKMIVELASNPAWDPSTLKAYVDSTLEGSEEYIQPDIIKAFGGCDDINGVQLLYSYLEGRRARDAMYAIRPALRLMKKEDILSLCRKMAWKGVSVAKEVVRLMGVARLTEARDELIKLFNQRDPMLHRDVRIAVIRAMWDYLSDPTTWDFLDATIDEADYRIPRKVCWVTTWQVPARCVNRLYSYFMKALNKGNIKLTAGVMQRLSERPVQDASGGLCERLVGFLGCADETIKNNLQSALRSQVPQLAPDVREKIIAKMFDDSMTTPERMRDMCQFVQQWRWGRDGTKTFGDSMISEYLQRLAGSPAGEMNAINLLPHLPSADMALEYLKGLYSRNVDVYRYVVWNTEWDGASQDFRTDLYSKAMAQLSGRDDVTQDEAILPFRILKVAALSKDQSIKNKAELIEQWRAESNFPCIQALAMLTTVPAESEETAAIPTTAAIPMTTTMPTTTAFISPPRSCLTTTRCLLPTAARRRTPGVTSRQIARGYPEPHHVTTILQRTRKRALLQD